MLLITDAAITYSRCRDKSRIFSEGCPTLRAFS